MMYRSVFHYHGLGAFLRNYKEAKWPYSNKDTEIYLFDKESGLTFLPGITVLHNYC
jgi:hypothetical protein